MFKQSIILAVILSCFAGWVHAFVADDNYPIRVDAPYIRDMACSTAPIVRTVTYTLWNNSHELIRLGNMRIIPNAQDTFTGTMTVMAGTCAGYVSGYGSCTQQVSIMPPTCANATPSLHQIIDRGLYIGIIHDTQKEVVAGMDAEVTVLGSAADFGILAKTNLANANASGTAQVTGDVGVGGTTSGTFYIKGVKYTNTSPIYINAMADATAAYNTLSRLPCETITGATMPAALNPGVYCFGNGTGAVTMPATLTLTGAGDFIFIFTNAAAPVVSNTFSVPAYSNVVLNHGALADNVYWVFNTRTPTINEGAVFAGNVITNTGTLTGATTAATSPATIEGRLLALRTSGNSISLHGNSVIKPNAPELDVAFEWE